MSVNWKVRLRNRQFWAGLVGALGTCALAVAGVLGEGVAAEVSPWVDACLKVATALLSALTLLGVVVDPTTEGVGDSEQAMSYEVPKPRE